tara:strand:- start:453 stop:1367 length:915 start_codon:yes stop_codon:yes gene_type:complete
MTATILKTKGFGMYNRFLKDERECALTGNPLSVNNQDNTLRKIIETMIQEYSILDGETFLEIDELKEENRGYKQDMKEVDEHLLKNQDDGWLEQSRDIAKLMKREKWGSACGDTLISVQELLEEITKLKLNLKVARERCDRWSTDEYNRGYKEATIEAAKDHKEFNEIWKTEFITEQDIINMKHQISEQCDIIKTLKGVVELLNDEEDNLKQRQEIRVKTDMLKNMILTMIGSENGDFEISSHTIKSDYNVTGVDDYNKSTHQFYNTLCKEMNDTDWNDDEKRTTLIYNDNYNISTEFKDDSDE